MLAAERHARITHMLSESPIVSTEMLVHELSVSGETVRRDLLALEKRGVLTRVHGGARSGGDARVSTDEPSFEQRSELGAAAKSRIAIIAAGLVGTGMTVMIDVGTTALLCARALPRDLSATVVTNSLLVAAELADRPHLEVMVCGGRIRSGDMALSGPTAVRFFEGVYPDVAFLGSGGIHAEAGLTDYYLEEAVVRRAVIRNARRSYALADSAKFDVVASHGVVGFDALTGVIAETTPPSDLQRAIEKAGAELVVA